MSTKLDKAHIKRIQWLTGAQKRLLAGEAHQGEFGRIQINCYFPVDFQQVCAAMENTVQDYDVLQSIIYDGNPDKMVQVILLSSSESKVDLVQSAKEIPDELDGITWRMIVDPNANVLYFVWHQALFDLISVLDILNRFLNYYFSANLIERSNNEELYQQYFFGYSYQVERGRRAFQEVYETVSPSLVQPRIGQSSEGNKTSDWECLSFSGTMNELSQTFLCAWGTIQQTLTEQQTIFLGISHNYKTTEDQLVGGFTNVVPYFFSCDGQQVISNVMEQMMSTLPSKENHQIDIYDVPMCREEALRLQSVVTITDDTLFTNIESNFPVALTRPDDNYYFYQSPSDLILQVVRRNHSEIAYRLLWQSTSYTDKEITALFKMVPIVFRQIRDHQGQRIKDILLTSEISQKHIAYENLLDNTLLYLDTDRFDRDETHVAVIDGGGSYSYGWFSRKVNQLANYLRANVYATDHPPVIVMMERSMEMLLVVHAILKSGAVYLPVDIHLPEDRIRMIIDDSKSKVIITNTGYMNPAIEVIHADKLMQESASYPDVSEIAARGEGTAYIIYTSGSTGKPKGVMVSHKSIYNRLIWIKEHCKIGESDRLVLKTPYTFDVSLIELLLWPLCGCSIYILPEGGHRDPKMLLQAITENQVSIIHFVPSMLQAFTYYFNDRPKKDLDNLRYVFSSGESLNELQIQNFYRVFQNKHIRILNLYGPTEAAVDVSYFECSANEKDPVPIGKAIPNVGLYAVDLFDRILPSGLKGQLVISGVALAQGYLNQPELTEQKFMFHHVLKERVYRTGDYVYDTDSEGFIFCGRMDRQIKLRGFRIELDEIKQALLHLPEINDAEIVLKNDGHGEDVLVAFIVPKYDAVNFEAIKEQLRLKLVNYMVPERMICLEKLPVNANGKTDTKALLQMDGASAREEIRTTGNSETEISLQALWNTVLGVQTIRPDESFFTAGGDSLKAIYLIAEINALFGTEWDINDIFTYPTIKQQVYALEREHYSPALPAEENIGVRGRINRYIVNSTQRRLYFLSRLNGNKAYNISGVYKVIRNLEKSDVEHVFNLIINQFDILRTSYHVEGHNVVAIVHDDSHLTVEERSIDRDAELEQTLDELSNSFDLETAPLMRVHLISAKDSGSRYLIIEISHVIADGISLSLLLQRFVDLYQGEVKELPDSSQYSVVSEKKESRYMEHQQYWLNELKSLPESSLPLRTDYPRPQEFTFRGSSIVQGYDKSLVQQCASLYGTTPSAILLTALVIFICKQSNHKDFIIGVVTSGRTSKEALGVVGPMINTLPLYIRFEEQMTGGDMVRYVHSKLMDLLQHQNYPVDDLIDRLQVDRAVDQNPLFNILYTYHNSDMDLDMESIGLKQVFYKPKAAKVDLSLFAYENKQTLELEYCKDLFAQESIQNFMGRYQKILQKLSGDQASVPVCEWDLFFEDERSVLFDVCKEKKEANRTVTIQRQFVDIVKQYPERMAIQFGEQQWSYKELNSHCNNAAAFLRMKGVGPGQKVGIILDNSPELIISIMAVLKLGACYVPIDLRAPEDRISFLIQDSNINLVITDNPSAVNCRTIVQVQEMMSLKVEENIPEICEGDIEDICYIIYTSGSTGTPKGCIIQQKSVSNYINWAIKQYFSDNAQEIPIHCPMFTSPSVDLTVTSIFAPLLSGNTMDVYPNELQSLAAIFLESQASIVKLTPTHLKFVAALPVQSTKVKSIIVGGEQLTKFVCDSIANSDIRIYNEYGPTESTVGCMIYEYDPKDPYPVVPIGKAIDNLGIYILNSHNQICLPGVEGEIYIAGVGLAVGYTDKHMTSQKFADVPISGQIHRMYRTGDHGYYLNDGNIIYTGRKDTQRKVRGYRIELAEIEACLTEGLPLESVYSFIHNERIIAAVVPKGDDPNIIKSVVDYAKRKLPIYMVPDSVIPIKELPMLTSGKMDEAAILSLVKHDSQGVDTGDAERGEALKEIKANIRCIWADILNTADFDDTDSFFDVGGNSILLLQLHNRVEEVYPGVQLMDYFKYTSINLISEYLSTGLDQVLESEINALPPHYLTGGRKQPARITVGISLSDQMAYSLEHSCRKYNISEVRFIGALLMAIMSTFVQSNYVSVAIAEEENVWNPIVPKMTDFEQIVRGMEESGERSGNQSLDISVAVSDKSAKQLLSSFDAVFIFERENRAINLSYDHAYLNGEEMERVLNLVKDILESIDD